MTVETIMARKVDLQNVICIMDFHTNQSTLEDFKDNLDKIKIGMSNIEDIKENLEKTKTAMLDIEDLKTSTTCK
jgi:hypothetical protein